MFSALKCLEVKDAENMIFSLFCRLIREIHLSFFFIILLILKNLQTLLQLEHKSTYKE